MPGASARVRKLGSSRYTRMGVCVQQSLLLFDVRSDDFVPKSDLQSQMLPRRLLPGDVGGGENHSRAFNSAL